MNARTMTTRETFARRSVARRALGVLGCLTVVGTVGAGAAQAAPDGLNQIPPIATRVPFCPEVGVATNGDVVFGLR